MKFLYVAPERLATEAFRLRVVRMNVQLIAVDEAHCISQWGYDFRPSYLRIAELRENSPESPCWRSPLRPRNRWPTTSCAT